MSDWPKHLPAQPQLGDELPKPELKEETLRYLALRRSLTAAQLGEPGPSPEERDALLAMAARVPDHRRVHPFRFLVFEGEARRAFGDVLVQAFQQQKGEATDEALEIERSRFERAPLVVAVISKVDIAHKTPEWEQILTAGAVAQNLLIAAGAAGYGAQWLTEWYAYDDHVRSALGLADHERVVGFLYIGTATEAPKERPRIEASALTDYWTAPRHRD
ncbi:nitroreductase family protein [Parvularcula lutaonensis]|uniref:Putative NAD(P)H nitroreductase n=1 Tax=Parvularcula lutaonensis TaxID=491923 RepID=A0ABV7M795_9PROT|nr:nitroreductase [Parvularcula lutaonensis]